MPCQSDYMNASGEELESKRVCEHILYLIKRMDNSVPKWISDAASDYYGNVNRLDEATKILCETCRSLSKEESEKYLYDAHHKDARRLADWFERHQEWDERRVAEEAATRKKVVARDRALKKLSVEEIEALGLI